MHGDASTFQNIYCVARMDKNDLSISMRSVPDSTLAHTHGASADMTYAQAAAKLPVDAKWSSSFGNPGEGGYHEFHRTPSGDLWIISNGSSWMAVAPFTWTCRPAPDVDKQSTRTASRITL